MAAVAAAGRSPGVAPPVPMRRRGRSAGTATRRYRGGRNFEVETRGAWSLGVTYDGPCVHRADARRATCRQAAMAGPRMRRSPPPLPQPRATVRGPREPPQDVRPRVLAVAARDRAVAIGADVQQPAGPAKQPPAPVAQIDQGVPRPAEAA